MMRVTTSKWDASKFLDDSQMMKEYLQIMFEENGVEGLQRALGDVAKAMGMGEIARKTNLSRKNLYRALSGNSSPNLDTVMKVIEALGFKLVIV